MSLRSSLGAIALSALICSPLAFAQSADVKFANGHPRLLVSPEQVVLMKASPALPSEFEAVVRQAVASIEQFSDELPDVPVPKDAGGGYTHEQHKRNSVTIQNAGFLYQLTGEIAYAQLARDMLLAYASLYPTLGEHPEKKNQSPGQLFWQSLNEAVWLVTSIQGYDAIYDFLSADERAEIETGLLRPMVSFISEQAPQTFDKIHNHGTWAVAAVGMTGYVIGDQDYVEKALFGLKKDGSAGFMKQLDELFSPDGYYSEGPYYQRYALMPFLLFSKSIQHNEPARKIFDYRDGILLKSIYTAINLSYGGYFFPINDAIKDKGLDTVELCYAVSIAYGMTNDPQLLSIAEQQKRIVLTGDGFRLAQAMDMGLAKPFEFESMLFRDGPEAEDGALAVLRNTDSDGGQALVFKATGQGMGHGHFDRLSWIFYDNGNEIVTDYGAARFLNVVEKNGGHYLPENNAWAKQTVAHNTLVVDQASQFDGDWKQGEEIATDMLLFEQKENIQIVAARMDGAYKDVSFTRVMALVSGKAFARPVVLDVLKTDSSSTHQYDLPLHYIGQLTKVSPPMQVAVNSLSTVGSANGYEYMWIRAKNDLNSNDMLQMTWLNENRFYTYSALADGPTHAIFTETGANDPNFNLRWEPGMILRASQAKNHTFVGVLEPHGEYNGSREFTTASASNIKSIERSSKADLDLIRIETKTGAVVVLALSYNADTSKHHKFEHNGVSYEWTGFYRLF